MIFQRIAEEMSDYYDRTGRQPTHLYVTPPIIDALAQAAWENPHVPLCVDEVMGMTIVIHDTLPYGKDMYAAG